MTSIIIIDYDFRTNDDDDDDDDDGGGVIDRSTDFTRLQKKRERVIKEVSEEQ